MYQGPGSRLSLVRRALVALCVAWLVPRPAAAQQAGLGAIHGVVRGAQDGLPIQRVSVRVKGSGLGASTAPDGRYTLTRVSAGEPTLVFPVIRTTPEERAGRTPDRGVPAD